MVVMGVGVTVTVDRGHAVLGRGWRRHLHVFFAELLVVPVEAYASGMRRVRLVIYGRLVLFGKL